MKKLLTLLLLICSFFASSAQSVISGFIRDAKGNGLQGVSLTLKETYDGATTDSTGRFSFKTSETGEQTLVVTLVGYKSFEQKLTLPATISDLNISLKEDFNEMKAVVISAGSFEASDRKRAGVVLNSIDMVTTAGSSADVTQALKTLPGAQRVGEAEGLFVRGGTAAETKIFIDGTLVNRFFFGAGPNIAGYGRFSPFLFKGTVFSTGGYSALYGQALSSAVILESIDLPERSSANLNVSVLSLGGGYQNLNKKKTASWGINFNYTDLRLAFKVLKTKQDYFHTPTIFNGEGNFRIQTSKTGMIKYYAVVSTNKLGFTTPSLDSNGYSDKFTLSNKYTYHNLSWRERIGKYWKMNAGVAYTYNEDNIAGGMRNNAKQDVTLSGLEFKNYRLNATGNYVNAKLVFERRLYGLSAIRFGTEYNFSNDKSIFTDSYNNKYPGGIRDNIGALFAEGDVYLTNALAAKIGARAEHSSYLGKTNIAPRVSLAYKLGEGSQASVAYGLFYQNPETRYLPAVNPLGFSKASHYILQYQKTTALRIFRTEVFYKNYDALVKTGFRNGRDGLAIDNSGFGDAKGFELFWRDKKSIKDFDYWVSYSYLDTKRNYLNFPYAITPNFAAKHTASLVMKKFVTPWKTGFNASYSYSSSRPYYNIAYSSGSYKFTDMGKIKDNHNVSFSLNYIPTLGKQNAKAFAVYVLSVNNIFNIKQSYGYQYSSNGNRRVEIVPPSRMFIFIGAFISFGIDRTEDAINNNL